MLSRASLMCRVLATRELHVSACANSDQIQQLFAEKIKDYASKQGAAPGGLVDPSPATEKAMQDELSRLARVYKMKSSNEAKTFPTISYEEPTFEPNVMFQEEPKEIKVTKAKDLNNYL